MALDFSKAMRLPGRAKPTDPMEIFAGLPSLPDTPNDIWRGQADALESWNEHRSSNDVLVALNTGAGKTIVGLLIAQSLVNEGVANVVYLCATIDLVRQTSGEADKLGIDHTTRIEGGYSNDLFEAGQAFCITTYQALLNGHSSIRRYHFPGAVIFDDAHVAEQMIRDAFSLRFSAQRDPGLFDAVRGLFEPIFAELSHAGGFAEAIDPSRANLVLVPPESVFERGNQLREFLVQQGVRDHNDLKYPYAHLQDKLDRCAIVFGYGQCEISPPFLPSLALDIFERQIRRVYLSATLKFKTDFVRAFGRMPDEIIEPRNDAGNGERLVLFGRSIDGGITPRVATQISAERKVLISVPSYPAAKLWADVGVPPQPETFSDSLNEFRASDNGAFILVSRVDGIDLPHDTCRIMILDGLPRGSALIERYLWQKLGMTNQFAARVANRVVQLFGRINRGRNDYGAFLISGTELNNWLRNERNLARLPELLQRQVLLGQHLQQEMNISDPVEAINAIYTILDRDEGWLEFYKENVVDREIEPEAQDRADEVEKGLTEAALAEAAYALASWDGDFASARRCLENSIGATARADSLLGGWHNVWLGQCYFREGDTETARSKYERARVQLGRNIVLPIVPAAGMADAGGQAELPPLGQSIDGVVGFANAESYWREFNLLSDGMKDLNGATPRQMEEAVRVLGEALGFESSRPDNEIGTGPDVLWRDEQESLCLAFELKTDKENPARYFKRDISQGHDHLAWITQEHTDHESLGLIYLGPDGTCAEEANPVEKMWVCGPQILAQIRDEYLALLKDIQRDLPLHRRPRILEECGVERWKLRAIADRLAAIMMTDMKE